MQIIMLAEHSQHDRASLANTLIVPLLPHALLERPVGLDERVMEQGIHSSISEVNTSPSLPT